MAKIWIHDLCDGPVMPGKIWQCCGCGAPVFSDECHTCDVSDKWLEEHPGAKPFAQAALNLTGK